MNDRDLVQASIGALASILQSLPHYLTHPMTSFLSSTDYIKSIFIAMKYYPLDEPIQDMAGFIIRVLSYSGYNPILVAQNAPQYITRMILNFASDINIQVKGWWTLYVLSEYEQSRPIIIQQLLLEKDRLNTIYKNTLESTRNGNRMAYNDLSNSVRGLLHNLQIENGNS